MKDQKNLKSVIESLIFIAGKPISIRRLVQITNVKESEIIQALDALKEDYKARGIKILSRDNAVQLISTPQNAPYVKKLLTQELQENLTRAALETLAVIAYRGPISRSKIEQIRGVNSVYILRNLLVRGLVDRERNKKDARYWQYRVSFDFLRHLGVQDIKELPEYEELSTKSQAPNNK